jgi:hypothetical protein
MEYELVGDPGKCVHSFKDTCPVLETTSKSAHSPRPPAPPEQEERREAAPQPADAHAGVEQRACPVPGLQDMASNSLSGPHNRSLLHQPSVTRPAPVPVI